MPEVTIPGTARARPRLRPPRHVTTTNPDGSPHVTGVWVKTEGDEIVLASLTLAKRYIRNLQRDPRIAVSLATGQFGEYGTEEYLVVYGTATITEGGYAELLRELARIYLDRAAGVDMGPNLPAADWADPSSAGGYLIHVAPERFGGSGPWVCREAAVRRNAT